MNKRDEYYDGGESNGAWVGIFVLAAVLGCVSVSLVLCFSLMAVL